MGALGRVRQAFALGLLACSTPLRADPVARWVEDIVEASARFGIERRWVEAVMRAESGGRTIWQGRPVTSSAGAMGLMQLMPGTWADMRRQYGLGADPHDPHDNIVAGTAYLAAMYARFGYPGLFGAYHAGPARYAEYVMIGRALPPETRAYMATIEATLGQGWAQLSPRPPAEPNPPVLFYYHAPTPETGASDRVQERPSPMTDSLFAVRRDVGEK